MSAKLPYMVSTGLITKILQKIIEAKIPDRFTADFLSTKLGHSGGSAGAFIPLLKRIGLLNGDGTPTDLYKAFRSDDTRGRAMAEAMRKGYSELFDRNEYAGDLDQKGLLSLVNQVSGAEKGNTADRATVATFLALKTFADFDAAKAQPAANEPQEVVPIKQSREDEETSYSSNRVSQSPGSVGMNLSYTINLNLPESTDPEVFNAIFKSLYDNILKQR